MTSGPLLAEAGGQPTRTVGGSTPCIGWVPEPTLDATEPIWF